MTVTNLGVSIIVVMLFVCVLYVLMTQLCMGAVVVCPVRRYIDSTPLLL